MIFFCRPECLENARETHSRECEVVFNYVCRQYKKIYICGFGHFPKLQFLLPTFSMWTEPPRIGLMIDPQNASAISTFLKVLVGSIIILPMKKVLAKCGGQVDFGEEGGSGWAQLVLPLRLLLFYKVGHRFFLLHRISLIYLIKYTRLVIGF